MHRPKDVADNLGISPATLRLWSNHFAELLSPAAQKATTEAGTSAQRRYTDTDLAYFARAKQHLNDGKTYEDTLRSLKEQPIEIPPPSEESFELPIGDRQTTSLAPLGDHPVFIAFRQALEAKDEVIRTKDALIAEKDVVIEKTVLLVTVREEQISAKEATITELQGRLATSETRSVSWWKRLFGSG